MNVKLTTLFSRGYWLSSGPDRSSSFRCYQGRIGGTGIGKLPVLTAPKPWRENDMITGGVIVGVVHGALKDGAINDASGALEAAPNGVTRSPRLNR